MPTRRRDTSDADISQGDWVAPGSSRRIQNSNMFWRAYSRGMTGRGETLTVLIVIGKTFQENERASRRDRMVRRARESTAHGVKSIVAREIAQVNGPRKREDACSGGLVKVLLHEELLWGWWRCAQAFRLDDLILREPRPTSDDEEAKQVRRTTVLDRLPLGERPRSMSIKQALLQTPAENPDRSAYSSPACAKVLNLEKFG